MAVEKPDPGLRWPVLTTCVEALNWLEIQANLGLAGRTERDVALDLEFAQRRLGAEGASFPAIVAFGEHGALPHARPRDAEIPRELRNPAARPHRPIIRLDHRQDPRHVPARSARQMFETSLHVNDDIGRVMRSSDELSQEATDRGVRTAHSVGRRQPR